MTQEPPNTPENGPEDSQEQQVPEEVSRRGLAGALWGEVMGGGEKGDGGSERAAEAGFFKVLAERAEEATKTSRRKVLGGGIMAVVQSYLPTSWGKILGGLFAADKPLTAQDIANDPQKTQEWGLRAWHLARFISIYNGYNTNENSYSRTENANFHVCILPHLHDALPLYDRYMEVHFQKLQRRIFAEIQEAVNMFMDNPEAFYTILKNTSQPRRASFEQDVPMDVPIIKNLSLETVNSLLMQAKELDVLPGIEDLVRKYEETPPITEAECDEKAKEWERRAAERGDEEVEEGEELEFELEPEIIEVEGPEARRWAERIYDEEIKEGTVRIKGGERGNDVY